MGVAPSQEAITSQEAARVVADERREVARRLRKMNLRDIPQTGYVHVEHEARMFGLWTIPRRGSLLTTRSTALLPPGENDDCVHLAGEALGGAAPG